MVDNSNASSHTFQLFFSFSFISSLSLFDNYFFFAIENVCVLVRFSCVMTTTIERLLLLQRFLLFFLFFLLFINYNFACLCLRDHEKCCIAFVYGIFIYYLTVPLCHFIHRLCTFGVNPVILITNSILSTQISRTSTTEKRNTTTTNNLPRKKIFFLPPNILVTHPHTHTHTCCSAGT